MEDIHITETESRYFGDLFLCCDAENCGRVPVLKATEMFRSANLSNDVIRQITCCAAVPQTAIHMTRTQFYSCLKLIAAHQAGVQPLRAELLGTSVALPLPKFSWTSSPTRPIDGRTTIEQMANGSDTVVGHIDRSGSAGSAAAAAASLRSPHAFHVVAAAAAAAADRRDSHTDTGNSDLPSTDSEVEHTDTERAAAAGVTSRVAAAAAMRSQEQQRNHGGGRHHPSGGPAAGLNGSPEAWSTASDSPTPTNSVTERPWAQNPLWQGLFCEEQRQLLGTEEESSDRHSSDEDPATTTAASLTASTTSNTNNGVDADLERVFQITAEQRDYYLNQFRTVQPDVRGLVGGQAARVFFEKSRIPVDELRHIWQLCDVTRDGALSLAEFTAAMHLVVLRRNAIPLPPVLPVCLDPKRMMTLLLAEATADGDVAAGTAATTPLEMEATTTATVACAPREADLLHLDDDADTGAALDGTAAGAAADEVVHTHRHDATPVLGSNASPIAVASQADSTTSGSPRSAAATVAASVGGAGGDWMSQSKEWTKFTESPTSNVSSPGPKPVNFDMQRTAQAVVSDPLILHPVPVRVTPIGGCSDGQRDDAEVLLQCIAGVSADVTDATTLSSGGGGGGGGGSGSPATANATAESYSMTVTSATHVLPAGELRAIQRPQPKKVPSNVGAIPPPPQRESSVGSAAAAMELCSAADQLTGQQVTAMAASFVEAIGQQHAHPVVSAHFQAPPPPPPPPRPHKHARSSSLDLNKLKQNGAGATMATAGVPPDVPPRVSPQMVTQASLEVNESMSFADFTHFPEGGSQINRPADSTSTTVTTRNITAALQSSLRSSAFEVYRKPPPTSITNHNNNVDSARPNLHSPEAASTGAAAAAVVAAPARCGNAATSAAIAAASSVSDYERRVAAINESLRHVSFKQSERNVADVVHHLREQNHLLMHLCSDLTEELATVHRKKEELRARFEEVSAAQPAPVATSGRSSNLTAPPQHQQHHSIV